MVRLLPRCCPGHLRGQARAGEQLMARPGTGDCHWADTLPPCRRAAMCNEGRPAPHCAGRRVRSVEPDYRTNEVRYYESIGLLAERSGGNYPGYGKDDVDYPVVHVNQDRARPLAVAGAVQEPARWPRLPGGSAAGVLPRRRFRVWLRWPAGHHDDRADRPAAGIPAGPSRLPMFMPPRGIVRRVIRSGVRWITNRVPDGWARRHMTRRPLSQAPAGVHRRAVAS